MKSNTTRLSLGAILGFTLLTSMAQAQVVDTSSTAGITIQPALTLTLINSPDWGQVTRPPTGTARYLLGWDTGATTLVSGDGFAFNDGLAGSFGVNGAPNAVITYNMAIGAFSGAVPVIVFAAHMNGVVDTGTLTLDGAGAGLLAFGGVLDVPLDATLGAQTATITVTIDYQ